MKDFSKELLSCSVEMGTKILEYGASVTYVEEVIKRICQTYGTQRSDVFVITSSIIVTIKINGENFTQSSRILKTGTDFRKLEDYSALVETICKEKPDISDVFKKIEEIENQHVSHPILDFFGRLLVGASFAIFFGGNWKDAICSAFCGGIVYAFDRTFQTLWNNKFVNLLFTSAVCGFVAVNLAKFGLCSNADKVMIGTIMLLIPGIAFTNGLRDLINGETISGSLRLLEAVIHASAIAIGFALAVIPHLGVLR
ncbi:MAG: threonine/serine exporter family protein [Treponema sp.]|nr:threonine/serine exporter family protein [Candidatus Treponema equifaecale]